MRTPGLRLTVLGAAVAAILASQGMASTAKAAVDVFNYHGANRQKVLEEGAKKEGQLTVYSALTINQALRPLIKGFQKKYPFVKTEFWRGTSRKIAQKALAEQRAHALVGDVLEGSGLSAIMVKAKAVQKFYTPEVKNIPEQYRDKDGLWVPSRISYFGSAYNTRMVPPGTQPKTYEDLLDPKWKGKLAWRAESESGALLFITTIRLSMGEQKADAYFKKLAKQNIVNFTGSARTLVNRVIEGEYPVALNIFMHHPIISAQKGAPVDSQPMAPIPSLSGTMVIPKGVKHPYAAMLFVDYYLSDEGQEVLKKAHYFPVIKSVGPRKELEKVVPSHIGMKELFVTPDTLFANHKKSQAIYKKYFK